MYKMIRYSLVLSALCFSASQAFAMPNKNTSAKRANLMKTTAGCSAATAVIDLDINNVKARVMTGGDMWWDQGTSNAAYEVPKGSRKNALYAGSCWVAGMQNGSLKAAAQLYRIDGNDYWPGPLNYNNGTYSIDAATCNEWDRFWKLDRTLLNEFIEIASSNPEAAKTEKFRTIWEWPARGNGGTAGIPQGNNDYDWRAKGSTGTVLQMDDRNYAPFVDLNENGVYDPNDGEYPNMDKPGRGNQMVWWVFNDRGNTKLQTKSESIGLEIQTTAFAFSTKDFLNDATFYDYKVINRAGLTLDSAFMATWTDADLGYAFDDYIGCDTARGLGILYNAKNTDGNGEPTSYGVNPPMVGVDFFIGPQKYFINTTTGLEDTVKLKMKSFTYFINAGTNPPVELQDPNNAVEFYFYMTGSRKNGQLFSYDFTGVGSPCSGIGAGEPVKFVFAGEMNSGWSECVCGNAPGDRRFIHSAGPFQLRPGDVNDIIIGVPWVAGAGGCPTGSFKKIKVADDLTQELFDNDFKTIDGPQAPVVTYREMDQKIIFYFQNPYNSTNFQEKFGYQIDTAKYRVKKSKAVAAKSADSLYKFEGYRVFQLRDASVTPAQIYDENGALNEELAKEVFQCDIKNGVTQIVNYIKDIDINVCDTCTPIYKPVIKINGKDSGIRHSFVLTQDAFANGDDQRFVNYKTYYFLAIAYSYNNFASFNPLNDEVTQETPYLESATGPNQIPLDQMIIKAIPNPANGNMGTTLNSDYGNGVEIIKLEGYGNGGNDIQINATSEDLAMSTTTNYQATQPIYQAGKTPIDLKVIDPLKVQGTNWKLYITPKDTSKPFVNADPEDGVIGTNAMWQLIDADQNKTIYSERTLDALNEQILADYGMSISVHQVSRPGFEQNDNGKNGYITSNITYENGSLPWLSGVNDGEAQSSQNWIRSGSYSSKGQVLVCDYNDFTLDTLQFFESMFANTTLTKGTWAPYVLGATDQTTTCGFGVALGGTGAPLQSLMSVDLVFTSDKSKWTKCAVIELRDDNNGLDTSYSEGKVRKFSLRKHASWNLDMDASGNPVYASDANDYGFSYFPGYVINQETGERLNIVFGEDSYLKSQNGRDMIWNPTSQLFDGLGNLIFGGKHYIYILNSKYDGGTHFASLLKTNDLNDITDAYNAFMWVGVPLANANVPMLSLKDGLIPTTTRLTFRVTRPYSYYAPPGVQLDNTNNVPGYPKYQFSTKSLALSKLGDAQNPYTNDKKKLLDRIHVVPNPYYAYDGYEKNRLDTRVKIINLPKQATIYIYSLDGSLIKKLSKDDDLSYIDWDVRNLKGLPIASGMYIFDIVADGIGETTIKWFGAMRPVDVNNF